MYVKAALALFAIVNWIMSKIDEAKREEVLSALWDQEFMKRDKEILDRANRVRSDIERKLDGDPDGLRSSDGFERP